ncbi:MAG: alpha/beta hydrolase [Verrucomicrobiota bacterium]
MRWIPFSLFLLGSAFAADEVKTGAMVYLEEPRRKLTIYYPDDWTADDKRPALVIFRCNIPYQREHFRKLGMVVIKPQTAPVNSGNLPKMTLEEIAKAAKPRDQIADTKSAIRFIRTNAAELGVDPTKIVATGTSGGGDLALQSHLNRAFEHEQDDRAVSCSPDALVLYCPAFDGIDIWFVKSEQLTERVEDEAPSFLALLGQFAEATNEYAQPLDHRATLIEKAATLGAEKQIDQTEIKAFQEILTMFNERDWQLLHPAEDALKASASRILTKDPLPPTIFLFGDRDHLKIPQENFIKRARELEQQFEMKIYKGGGHSFMMQPAFQELSTQDVQTFLEAQEFLPK